MPAAALSDAAATIQQETVFWQSIRESSDPVMFREYLRQYPGGNFAGLARIKLAGLGEAAETANRPQPEEPEEEVDVAVAIEGDEGDSEAHEWQSGDELRAILIGTGNKIKGISDGAWWVESYEPNGNIRGLWRGVVYSGRWSINGDIMCFDHVGTSSDWCGHAAIRGDKVFWWDENGEPGDEDIFVRK